MKILSSIIFILTATSSLFALSPSTKEQMKSSLDVIAFTFDVGYAPAQWKKDLSGWNLFYELTKAKNKIDASCELTPKEYQKIVREFLGSTQDYHVRIDFYSTESSKLPLRIKGAEGKYYISWIDRHILPEKRFDFRVGDEVVSMNGQPVKQILEELKNNNFISNVPETDELLAQMYLTIREGRLGYDAPQGSVDLKIRRRGTSKSEVTQVNWIYSSEFFPPFISAIKSPGHRIVEKRRAFRHDRSFLSAEAKMLSESKESLGSRRTFLPYLGKVVWESDPESFFHAYIFLDQSGKKIGYIRIADYIAEYEDTLEFANIITRMKESTEALVLDQVNNPGGSVFYLYTLVSMLTDRPMEVPSHSIALTQDDLLDALFYIDLLELVPNDESILKDIQAELMGFPIDYEMTRDMLASYQRVVEEWKAGHNIIHDQYLLGVKYIKPNPAVHYDKPILMLINSLDFSGGDFMPAIMQDNQRATLLGTRTAGAGGYVLRHEFPNRFGIKGFKYTGSIAHRTNGQPLENLGVQPDIPYELTKEDLKGTYVPYRAAIRQALSDLTD